MRFVLLSLGSLSSSCRLRCKRFNLQFSFKVCLITRLYVLSCKSYFAIRLTDGRDVPFPFLFPKDSCGYENHLLDCRSGLSCVQSCSSRFQTTTSLSTFCRTIVVHFFNKSVDASCTPIFVRELSFHSHSIPLFFNSQIIRI